MRFFQHRLMRAMLILGLVSTIAFPSWAQDTGESVEAQDKGSARVFLDELNRGTPRGCVEGYFEAIKDKDYTRAAEFLDLRSVAYRSRSEEGPLLARQLQTVIERALWIDRSALSAEPEGKLDDGLPENQELIGKAEIEGKNFHMLLQRISGENGTLIWKFSATSVRAIPQMYEHVKYGPLGELLSKILPDFQFLGVPLWQWGTLLLLLGLSYLAARILGRILEHLLRKRTVVGPNLTRFIHKPVRLLLTVLIFRASVEVIKPSVVITLLLRAETLLVFAVMWTLVKSLDLLVDRLTNYLKENDQEGILPLLRPVNSLLQGILILAGVAVWLDNIGFEISTLLTGFGIGGAALALAAQDTLKNIFGSIMIMFDKPFIVGQRVIVKGHDGVVEEIGVRSTKLRLLNGHQTIIPNEEMAKTDIENIGRRPYIKRSTNIRLAYDTPPAKIEKALEIIQDILDRHEGHSPDFPPRVYFNEFNSDSLNIMVLYWFHPPDYWAFCAMSQDINLRIIQTLEGEGIRLALPSNTTYLDSHTQNPFVEDIKGGEAASEIHEP